MTTELKHAICILVAILLFLSFQSGRYWSERSYLRRQERRRKEKEEKQPKALYRGNRQP
jgi:hypothetical protein